MKTINQMLPKPSTFLQQFQKGFNQDMFALDQLRITPKPRIAVAFYPSEYKSTDGHYWQCQHADTVMMYEEISDMRKALEGIDPIVRSVKFEMCSDCLETIA